MDFRTTGWAFERWRKLGPVGRYLAKAALPIYILHQTVIVMLCYFFLNVSLSPAPKFLVLACLVMGVTLLLYELMRRNRVTAFVLGVPAEVIAPPVIQASQKTAQAS